MRKYFGIVLLIIIVTAVVAVFGGCRVQKDISRESTSVDSSYVKQLEQENRMLKIEYDEIHAKLAEKDYSTVVFDNNCDSMLKAALLKAGCNSDSIAAVLALYKSKVKYYADGSIEAEGNLKFVSRTKSKLEETVRNLLHVNDSLSHVVENTAARVVTNTEYKERVVKRGISGLMWGLFILIIIAAFICGFWLCWKYKDPIQEQLDAENI